MNSESYSTFNLVFLWDEATGRKGESRAATAQWCELRVSWRGCRLGIASTQSRGIPRESGLSGSATRFSPYSVHFSDRSSRRRDADVYRLARSRNRWRDLDWGLKGDETSPTRSPTFFPRVDIVGIPEGTGWEEFWKEAAKWVSRTPSITRPARRRTITLCCPATSLPRWDLARWSEFLLRFKNWNWCVAVMD